MKRIAHEVRHTPASVLATFIVVSIVCTASGFGRDITCSYGDRAPSLDSVRVSWGRGSYDCVVVECRDLIQRGDTSREHIAYAHLYIGLSLYSIDQKQYRSDIVSAFVSSRRAYLLSQPSLDSNQTELGNLWRQALAQYELEKTSESERKTLECRQQWDDYTGKLKTRRILRLTAAVGAIGSGAVAYLFYKKSEDDYDRYMAAVDPATISSAYDDHKSHRSMSRIGLGVAAGFALVEVYLLLTKPHQPGCPDTRTGAGTEVPRVQLALDDEGWTVRIALLRL